MKNIKIFLSMFLLFVVANSCTKKDIELESTQQSANLFYKTDMQANQALVAAYDPMGWVWRNSCWGGSLITWGNFASDDAYTGGGSSTDQPTYQDADTYKVSPTDNGNNLISFWGNYFMGVGRANLIIGNLTDDTPYKKSVIAQAYFLKGFYYFYLSRMFGGLPLVKQVPMPSDLTKRSSLDETYTYTEELLATCIASGNMQKRTGTVDPANGMATIGSAQALMGKVLLYHKKYADAIPYLEAVVNSGNYQLDPAFWHIFKGNNLHGVESVFEINFANATSSAGNEGNSDIYLFGPRGTNKFNDTITYGWGFNQPTKALVDAFDEMGDVVRKDATIFTSEYLEQCIGGTVAWNNELSGFWDRKHYPDPNNYDGSTFQRFTNPDVILRLADVYLMLAECYVRTGNSAKALENINIVRKRAHLTALTSVSLTDVKKERRLELALEAERYFDLVRWTGDADKIDAANVLGPLGYDKGTPGVGTNGLFPIPQKEINSTYEQNKLEQNPGY